MTWLVPSALVVAGIAAIATIALHFIARSRPLAEPLPTARFIPARPIHARTRSIALSDVLLLLLRILSIALIGMAVAAPIGPARGRVARIVLADRSLDVASMADVRDSVQRYMRGSALLVAFDTSAQRATLRSLDTSSAARGSLSAALAAGVHEATTLASRADSVELVLVSPLAMDERDSATMSIRQSWPGRIRVVRVAAAPVPVSASRAEVVAPAGDAVRAGLALAGAVATGASVRVVRGTPTVADSAWASTDGHVLVHWPATDADAAWPRRATIDAIGAVSSATGTLVSRFPRLWELSGSTVARWADGEPAAVEHTVGGGCIRDVGLLLDESSDLTLHSPFRAFARALLAPCGGARDTRPLEVRTVASIAGTGGLAPTAAFRTESARSPWTPWLLLAGAILLLVEPAVRRADRRLA